MNHKAVVIAGSLLGVAVGSTGGYILAKKKMQEALDSAVRFAEDCEEELNAARSMAKITWNELRDFTKAKDFYDRHHKLGVFVTPEAAAEALIPAEVKEQGKTRRKTTTRKANGGSFKKMTETEVAPAGVADSEEGQGDGNYILQQREPGKLLPPVGETPPDEIKIIGDQVFKRRTDFDEMSLEERAELKAKSDRLIARYGYKGDTEVVTRNVFNTPANHGGEEVSDELRYVISKDDFLANEQEYQEAQVTWYEGDGVLTDEREVPFGPDEDPVGRHNLRFGELSGEPHVVYIKNDQLSMLIEVTRSTGKYSKEVAGFDDDNDIEVGDLLEGREGRKIRGHRR